MKKIRAKRKECNWYNIYKVQEMMHTLQRMVNVISASSEINSKAKEICVGEPNENCVSMYNKIYTYMYRGKFKWKPWKTNEIKKFGNYHNLLMETMFIN